MGETSTVAAAQGETILNGLGEQLLKLVSKGATSKQWAEWLRVPLEHAVAGGDEELALRLLKAGADGGAGWKGCNDRTLLQAAAEGGSEEIVSALIEKGGLEELNAASGEKEMTALHRASDGGHVAAARVLMIEGANVRLLGSRGRNALHYAAEGGNLQLFQDLMIAGVDPEVDDATGDTPLHLAAAKGHEKMVSTMLHRGCDAKITNSKGQHALHLAVDHGNVAVVEKLLKAGADANVRYSDNDKFSPLQLGMKDPAMTRALVKHGADVKSTDNLGFTALHWAASYESPAVIDALLEAGADPEAQSFSVRLDNEYYFKGLTPLHLAAFWQKIGPMTSLLQNGASINARDDQGLTPLHVVCKTSKTATNTAKAADFLLRRGADETISDDDGKRAIDLVEDSSGADLTGESLKRLLINAPADRAWRRRGMLVMCRSCFANVESGGREAQAKKIIRHDKGAGNDAGAATGASASDAKGDDGNLLLTRVAEMDADSIFRKIVLLL